MAAIGRPGQRGVALLTVIWVMVVVAALAAGVSVSSRTEALMARNLVDTAKAEALADAGVHVALFSLLGNTASPFRADGTPYAWGTPEGEVRFTVQDEGGRVDLNVASQEVLERLFVAAGLGDPEARALATAILDFRDPDNESRPEGAEDREYARADLDYDAKNGPFQLVDEVSQVLGMTGALFNRLLPVLTVHGQLPEPHPDTMPLGARDLLMRVLDEDAVPGETSSDRQADSDAAGASRRSPVSLGELAVGDREGQPDEDLATASGIDVFEVHAEGRTTEGAVFARQAVVQIEPGGTPPYRFLAWRRARRTLFGPEPLKDELGID